MAAAVTLATWVISVQIKLSCDTTTRGLPATKELKATVPKVLNAYWTMPKTQRGNRRTSRTSPRSLASRVPPASARTISLYTIEAAKVEMIEVPTANREDQRSAK